MYNKKSWLIKLVIACLLLLCISISIKKYSAQTTSSIAFLNLRKNTGIVFKSGNSAIVLTNLADTDRNYSYSVQPYLDSTQVNDATIISPNQNISLPYLKKQGPVVQFYDKRIIIFDKRLQNRLLPQKLKTNYLYITGNPHLSLFEINRSYEYQVLIIDGSNSNQTILKFEGDAKRLHVNYKILKRNISLITLSNYQH